MTRKSMFLCVPMGLVLVGLAWGSWESQKVALMTKWAERVRPENAWRMYPRPGLVRDEWLCLNGLWDYAIVGPEGEWTSGRLIDTSNTSSQTVMEKHTSPIVP